MNGGEWTLPAGLRLRLDAAVDGRVEGLWVFLATDRPDRLEVRFAGDSGAAMPRPGERVALDSADSVLFRGMLDRVELEAAASGKFLRCIAYAEFHNLRASATPRRWRRVTDAEVALAVADELGLVGDIEPTGEVHDLVEVAGDPLRFLRGRAERCGYRLAVIGRRLCFRRELPRGAEVGTIDGRRGLVAVQWSDSRENGRSGKIELPGDPRWRPRTGFGLTAVPGVEEKRYVAERVLHLAEAAGYRTVVEFAPAAVGGAA